MAGVQFDKVRKAFGSAVAVAGLDLTIGEGEFVSLLGPSGCGKTTTLRMLAGLEYPTSGRISIADRVVNDVPPAKRDIAMVFQSYALYPHMTVAENIAYPLKKRGIGRAERGPLVKRAAELLQLEALLDRKPRQLSGGQQQRVALGRALVREPKVFLLDEPLSNLDAKLRAHMRAELIELHHRIGKTMVYVTHDQLEAMTMSTRIAVMQAGVLQQYAAPAEIYNRPANLFVASFIGTPSMTLIEGELVRRGNQPTLKLGELALPLPVGHAVMDDDTPVRAVTIGVRPEDVVIGSGPIEASVKVVEPTGHESIVLFDMSGAIVTARAGNDVRLRPGEPVRLGFRGDKIHLFDRASGTRINSDVLVAPDTVRAGRV
ncbi:MAG: ABC transporter ATP-binding protein [Rhizobiales bacterium]|nr:ABC transporter ATP-binding protein [Hyphomicrobiales bacterium]